MVRSLASLVEVIKRYPDTSVMKISVKKSITNLTQLSASWAVIAPYGHSMEHG